MPPSEPDPPIFDRALLSSRLMNDEELMRAVAASYLGEAPRQVEALRGFLEAGDVAGARRQSHTIKGASANVAGERVRQTAAAIEAACKADDLDTARGLLPQLLVRLDDLYRSLRAAFGEQA